ncbi:MAG: LacI family transcriptional regulator [Oscillospiraceae bacterium]|nr:LacI family transcriptional regulator [Oscillospiraceae bacterium]
MIQTTKYEAVKQYLVTQITGQRMRPGDRIASEAELSKSLGVSSITIKKALSDLTAEGLIHRVKGRGSFVSERKPAPLSRTVAMLFALHDIDDGAFMRIIQGAQSLLSADNCSMFVECIGEDLFTAKKQLSRLIDQGVDGFMLYLSEPDNMLELIDMAQSAKPVVMLDRKPSARDMTYAGCNNMGGAIQAVNHLIEYGHERIGFAFFNDYLSSEKERYLGYAQTLAAHGVDASRQHQPRMKTAATAEIEEAVRSGRATAYFAVNDDCAFMMYDHAVRAGLSVPEDVSLIGFDNNLRLHGQPYWAGNPAADNVERSSAAGRVPSITTVEQSFEALGKAAASLMLGVVQGTSLERTQTLVGTKLIERNSVARPNTAISEPQPSPPGCEYSDSGLPA